VSEPVAPVFFAFGPLLRSFPAREGRADPATSVSNITRDQVVSRATRGAGRRRRTMMLLLRPPAALRGSAMGSSKTGGIERSAVSAASSVPLFHSRYELDETGGFTR